MAQKKATGLVPGISSNVTNRLGLQHAPRIRHKWVLDAAGLLVEGYNTDFRTGFDHYFCSMLGLDPVEANAFLRTFPSEAAWADYIEAKATNLKKGTAEFNALVDTYEHDEAIWKEVFTRAEIPESEWVTQSKLAAYVNDIDDALTAEALARGDHWVEAEDLGSSQTTVVANPAVAEPKPQQADESGATVPVANAASITAAEREVTGETEPATRARELQTA